MNVICTIAGMQYKISPDKLIYVRHLGGEYKEGEEIIFNTLIFFSNYFTDKVKIKGKIMAHIKEDKVTIFKKKRRKGYQIKRGHRQIISIIKIISIELNNHGS